MLYIKSLVHRDLPKLWGHVLPMAVHPPHYNLSGMLTSPSKPGAREETRADSHQKAKRGGGKPKVQKWNSNEAGACL